MQSISRRRFLSLLGAATAAPVAVSGLGQGRHSEAAVRSVAGAAARSRPGAPEFHIRTITAGVTVEDPADLRPVHEAVEFLMAARARLADRYEVQTIRVTTQPISEYLPDWPSRTAIETIRRMDQIAVDAGAMLNIGPVLVRDGPEPEMAAWAATIVQETANVSFSSFVASEEGLHQGAIRAAAETISTISRATPGGEGNFRFCATAFCPPGTPFFPAGYHRGTPAFAIGLESPGILDAALNEAEALADADEPGHYAQIETVMRSRLNAALVGVETDARAIAADFGRMYLGIDTSPAPGLEMSIGGVIERLIGAPFGSPATLSACSMLTNVLQGLDVKTCGYSGLMLPVIEDRVLAQRAAEGRYGISELLLYSSVCGTGLDVVPLPGDATVDELAATIGDVASLALRYRKPLSARLFPIPGKEAGDEVTFENPFLTDSRVMSFG